MTALTPYAPGRTTQASQEPASSLPRGIRNNNPGNIRSGLATQWKGLARPRSDGAFCRFESPVWGLRALYRVLLSYRRRGVVTLRSIVSRWAPPCENDTKAYLRAVSRATGIDPDAMIDVSDPSAAIPLARAIVAHENGPGPEGNRDWYDLQTYAAGFEAAVNQRRVWK